MNSGVIAADIIGSTSLALKDKYELIDELRILFKALGRKFKTYCRITKGDLIECYIPKAASTMKVALIIKSFIKSKTVAPFQLSGKKLATTLDARTKYFRIHGVRMAIAIAPMETVDRKKDIIEGDAIYLAGREISGFHTSNKQRIVIKNTLFFITENEQWQKEFEVMMSLIDVLLSKCTARQCEILFNRLTGRSEEEIAKELLISQSAVNQALTSAGWNAIEKAILRFESIIN